jgi:hypothetical protein
VAVNRTQGTGEGISGKEIKNHNDQNMHSKNHVDRLWLEYAYDL